MKNNLIILLFCSLHGSAQTLPQLPPHEDSIAKENIRRHYGDSTIHPNIKYSKEYFSKVDAPKLVWYSVNQFQYWPAMITMDSFDLKTRTHAKISGYQKMQKERYIGLDTTLIRWRPLGSYDINKKEIDPAKVIDYDAINPDTKKPHVHVY